ncbi:hypothetical protein A5798_002550 [Enterococcus sp. 6C8_DIV0013]|nr:hypothetical protein A5798_002550 [Enterococcus sp. 6C8_DIV0013]
MEKKTTTLSTLISFLKLDYSLSFIMGETTSK